ncbi:LytR C-terminal domain-containing protein [Candidatus Berkelbacteria bacterium]|nr:LytR C-terminal domain-containing protein [Candidatus Berkelbacteria bacterium]
MPTFDGIRASPRTVLQSKLTHNTRPRSKRSRDGVLLFVPVVAVLALLFIRPTLSRETESLSEKLLAEEKFTDEIITADEDNDTRAPAKTFKAPVAQIEDSLDALVILDQPTTNSAPQEEKIAPKTPKTFTVRVLNGGSATGVAAKIRDQLKSAQINVSSIGNAKTTHQISTIYYLPGFMSEAQEVQYLLDWESAELKESDLPKPDQLLVVAGQE